MRQASFRSLAIVVGYLIATAANPLRADEKETRIYRASVDGSVSGSFSMSFVRRDDGSETITTNADIKVRVLFREYRYSHQGVETWTKGALTTLQTETN